ncbi:protein hgh1 [Anaeramoeba ignava]|uniref:Protein HGH1 homolog n=1 Tax=Anaeramoeba ignava TaxID=1746090 RepID=A0A9Q0LAB6_ANAIG|nr:protein hgh1 [Anaeramoeba ignava]
MEQLISFLKHPDSEVRLTAVKNLLSFTIEPSSQKMVLQALPILFDLLSQHKEEPEMDEKILSCFVNIAEQKEGIEKMIELGVLEYSIKTLLDPEISVGRTRKKLYLWLLGNITRVKEGSEALFKIEFGGKLISLYEKYSKFIGNENEKEKENKLKVENVIEDEELAILMNRVILNITQIKEGRDFVFDSSCRIIYKVIGNVLMEFPVGSSFVKIVLEIVKNCCFEIDQHQWMISEFRIFEKITRFIMSKSMMKNLKPYEVKELPDYFLSRDDIPDEIDLGSNVKIREEIIRIILQLTTTRFGRDKIREFNIYYLLRELDAVETDEKVGEMIFEVIQIIHLDEEKTNEMK